MSDSSANADRGLELPAPEPVDIGIIAALPLEVRPLRDELSRVRSITDTEHRKATVVIGEFAAKTVAILVSGMGQKKALAGAQRLIAGHHPRWLFSVGFGGALDPELGLYDTVVANEVVDATNPESDRLTFDVRLAARATTARPRVLLGRLVTVSKIVRTAEEKNRLRVLHQGVAVEMETAAVGRLCADRAIGFRAVRVMSDTALEDLPEEIAAIVGPSDGFRLGVTLGAIMKRPSSVGDLWNLRDRAGQAAERLAEVLPMVIEGLD